MTSILYVIDSPGGTDILVFGVNKVTLSADAPAVMPDKKLPKIISAARLKDLEYFNIRNPPSFRQLIRQTNLTFEKKYLYKSYS
jgi:hypothetical protein